MLANVFDFEKENAVHSRSAFAKLVAKLSVDKSMSERKPKRTAMRIILWLRALPPFAEHCVSVAIE